MRRGSQNEIDELLDELDVNLKRLRMEYEQFFLGNMRREPQALRGKVQKVVTKLVNEPPRNSRQKFRFNALNARFQVYRQLWGRTMRQIEAGTYKRDRFKAALHSSSGVDGSPARDLPGEGSGPNGKGKTVDQLYKALLQARQKSGDPTPPPTRATLERMVRDQVQAIKKKKGEGARVKFKVVVEGKRAKIKASLARR